MIKHFHNYLEVYFTHDLKYLLNRHLLKPMMIVTTTGYIVSAIGPYLADGKNSDAKILNHIMSTDTEEIKTCLQEDDILIVDRGFRDSAGVLADLGIQMEMPSFLQRGHKQHTTEDANSSRLITKVYSCTHINFVWSLKIMYTMYIVMYIVMYW